MEKYEQIDISGDAGLRVRGGSVEELFENAAAGMFSLITDVSSVSGTVKREINISADNIEDLLIRWLNELIFIFDAYGFTGRTFDIIIKNNKLKASVSGGTFDPEINESSLLIKAATYHGLSVKKLDTHWEAAVIFDI